MFRRIVVPFSSESRSPRRMLDREDGNYLPAKQHDFPGDFLYNLKILDCFQSWFIPVEFGLREIWYSGVVGTGCRLYWMVGIVIWDLYLSDSVVADCFLLQSGLEEICCAVDVWIEPAVVQYFFSCYRCWTSRCIANEHCVRKCTIPATYFARCYNWAYHIYFSSFLSITCRPLVARPATKCYYLYEPTNRRATLLTPLEQQAIVIKINNFTTGPCAAVA